MDARDCNLAYILLQSLRSIARNAAMMNPVEALRHEWARALPLYSPTDPQTFAARQAGGWINQLDL